MDDNLLPSRKTLWRFNAGLLVVAAYFAGYTAESNWQIALVFVAGMAFSILSLIGLWLSYDEDETPNP